MLKEYVLNRFDPYTKAELDLLCGVLRERNVGMAGLSVRSPYVHTAGRLSRAIRDRVGIPVVWGGIGPTVTPELCLSLGADYVVVGEGEEAMAELARALLTGASPRSIANVGYNSDDGPKINPVRAPIEELDRLPFPDLDDADKFYIHQDKLVRGEVMRRAVRYEAAASRGCPYRCAYCSNSAIHEAYAETGYPVRTFGVDRVIRELEYAASKLPHLRSVFFMDEVFAWREEWLEGFSEQYPERVGLQFECQCDPRTVTKEKIRRLKRIGLAEMTIGIQSGSERIRCGLFERRAKQSQIIQAADWLHECRVPTRYDVITDNPYETSRDKRDTLDLLLRLPRPFLLNLWSLFHLPGTKLTMRALEDGVIAEEDVIGAVDKPLHAFTVSFRQERSREDRLWAALYMLTSKSVVPKAAIRWAAGRSWFQRHPLPIQLLSRALATARVLLGGLRLLITGRIDFAYARRMLRSLDSFAR
jgi:radical SAM superfamily enzyme YgiQ (UPF0313 family)